MSQSSSFHIYDDRRDYSQTNIRDLLFDVKKKQDSYDFDNDKGRNSYMNLFGKGGFGIRHFVTINLFLTISVAQINQSSVTAAMPYMLNHTARWAHMPPYKALYAYRSASLFPNTASDHVDDADDFPLDALSDDVHIFNISTRYPDTNYDCPLIRRKLDIQHIDEGPFVWSKSEKKNVLFSFYYTFIPAKVPAALIARRFGAKPVISTGLLIQSLFAMMIPAAAESGLLYLQIVRMIQGAALAPVTPCTYMLLVNWIPPCERSRMVAFVLSGVILGDMLLNYLSKMLCVCQLCGGCAAHFYFFAACSVMLSMFFTFFMWEDPEICPVISNKERRYIMNELGRSHMNYDVPSQVPWKSFATSMPCWALLFAEVANEYVTNTAFCQLPNFMVTVLHTIFRHNEMIFTLPLMLIVSSCLILAVVGDFLIQYNKMRTITVRKLYTSIALYGGAIGISVASHIGCNPNNIIVLMSITMLLNGAIFSGYMVNYLEISSNFVGVLVAITTAFGSLAYISSHFIALWLTQGKKTLHKWQLIFFIAALVSAAASTFYVFLASSERQTWDRVNIPHSTLSKTKSVTFIKDEPKGDTASKESIK